MALMGAGRVYRGQDVGISRGGFEALFASTSAASAGFHGSRSMMCFEDFDATVATVHPFSRRSEIEVTSEDDLDECGLHQPEKKRRLTMDQVQFLEKSFEVESKLEPERKLQLARDLGLQPRQVAIWFQNRRARWKTKQLEKDYEVLQASFKILKSNYDDQFKEREKLKAEVQVLTDKLLLREERSNTTTSPLHLPTQLPSLVSPPPLPPPPQLPCKWEDVCSATSPILDHDNSHYTEEGWHSPHLVHADSSNVPELDNSDMSQPEEDEGERKLESSCYGFEEGALWFWSC